jgi:hypothetical protein
MERDVGRDDLDGYTPVIARGVDASDSRAHVGSYFNFLPVPAPHLDASCNVGDLHDTMRLGRYVLLEAGIPSMRETCRAGTHE